MGRKRKVPDPAALDVPRARLWQWLVEHGGVDTRRPEYEEIESQLKRIQGVADYTPEFDKAQARGMEPRRILGETYGRSDRDAMRRGAVAAAILNFDMVASDRSDARYYLDASATIAARATEANAILSRLSQALPELQRRAESDCASWPAISDKWPQLLAERLARGAASAEAALAEVKGATEDMDAHVWGSFPHMLSPLSDVALHLHDAGFSYREIADLIDDDQWKRAGDPPEKAVERVKKRISWARRAIGRSESATASPLPADAGSGDSLVTHGRRRSAPSPDPASRRRPRRALR